MTLWGLVVLDMSSNYQTVSGADPEQTCDFSKFQVWKNVGHHDWAEKIFDFSWLKHSESAFPCLRYSAKIDNDLDQSCHGLICYYGFSI